MALATAQDIARNIQQARNHLLISQGELAELLNEGGAPGRWGQTRVSNIENSVTGIKAEIIPHLAKALSVPIRQLFEVPGEPITFDRS